MYEHLRIDPSWNIIYFANIPCIINKVSKQNCLVEATSTDPNVRIRFSLTDTDDFYIDESTGDIFLINNYGLGSLPSSPQTF